MSCRETFTLLYLLLPSALWCNMVQYGAIFFTIALMVYNNETRLFVDAFTLYFTVFKIARKCFVW